VTSKTKKSAKSNKAAEPLGLGELSGVVNVKVEVDERLTQLAEEKKVALIAFIAPWVSVRVSPVGEVSAAISLPDEFGIEALVELLNEAGVRNAYLLVNSPGGAMSSSYKIARAIRSTLDHIVSFVPHIAASGGTLLALTGNEIVMGPMSHLTPLDVQMRYKGTGVSAATFMRFLTRASKWFERIRPEEAPYPHKRLTDQLDPLVMEEWSGAMDAAISYVGEILELAGYEDSEETAQNLVLRFPTHSYVITRDKARQLGLSVKDSEDVKDTWDTMRYWLSKYIFEEEITHCIRYVLPTMGKESQDATREEKNATKE